jgi:L-ascorbate metabolism protein UlaG (beta-lactamase superfamily)
MLVAFLLGLSAQDAPPLSEAMSLPEIERALRAYPPSPEAWDARRQIAASLDRHVRVQVKDGLTDEDRAALAPLRDFYRRRVDEGLDRLERARVTEGVRVFKFYSSSVVLKSAEGTVAVDFAQGPVNNGGEPEARDARRMGFYWTPEQRERLARLVDVSLITHRHHDHSDYSTARLLLERGKAVVAPAQLKKIWKDLADRLTVPDYGRPQKVGPVELYTMLGCQYSRNRPEGTVRVGVPNAENPEADSETVVYLFRLGGLVFMQAGENHVPVDDWFRKGAELGFSPDVRMSVGQFQGARSADARLKERPPCLTLPVHEYEMTHEGGGNRMSPHFRGKATGRVLPLFWGEEAAITREAIARLRP